MALALALARAAAQANVAVRCESLAFYATKVSKKATDAAAASTELTTTKKEWDAVKVPEATASKVPTAVGGAAFPGDLRAVSGLGMGDGITSHTGKWLQVRKEGVTMTGGGQRTPWERRALTALAFVSPRPRRATASRRFSGSLRRSPSRCTVSRWRRTEVSLQRFLARAMSLQCLQASACHLPPS